MRQSETSAKPSAAVATIPSPTIKVEQPVPDIRAEAEQKDFIFVNNDRTLLEKYVGNSEFVTVPTNVKIICDGAFSGKKRLKSVTLPDGVLQIGSFAFANCLNLSCLDIKYGLISIGDKAFSGCRNMTILLIPKSIEKIGANAFEKCPRLIAAFTSERS